MCEEEMHNVPWGVSLIPKCYLPMSINFLSTADLHPLWNNYIIKWAPNCHELYKTAQKRTPFMWFRWKKCPFSEKCCHWQVVSSVANPICQEGQSERTFPIFAFSSRFFLFFPGFSWFFPDFWQIFRCQGGTLPPLPPQWLCHCK